MAIYRSEEGEQEIQEWCLRRIGMWDQPHEARIVNTALGSTHVVTAGAGPDLVLLPGTNFTAATSLDLVGELARTHTVHAVDLPGQPGLSAAQRPKRGHDAYGYWLCELLPLLCGSAPLVVAHSLGAVAALSSAARGARVNRLVLLDPAGVMRLRVSAAVLGPTMAWLRKRDDRTSAGLLQMMMGPESTPDADLVTWMTLIGRHVRTSLAPPPLPVGELRRLGGIGIDIISGNHDRFLPPTALHRAVKRRLPGARFAVVDNAGHLLPLERPDAVLGHILHAQR